MDNILFENISEMTAERYIEYANNPVGKDARKKFIRWKTINSVLLPVMVVIAVILAAVEEYLFAVCYAIITAAFAYKFLFQRKKLLKKQFESVLKSHNSDKWVMTYRFSDKIDAFQFNTTTVYSYDQFSDITADDRTIYLWLNEDFVLRVEKDCFTIGNAEEFLGFISEKINAPQ